MDLDELFEGAVMENEQDPFQTTEEDWDFEVYQQEEIMRRVHEKAHKKDDGHDVFTAIWKLRQHMRQVDKDPGPNAKIEDIVSRLIAIHNYDKERIPKQ